MQHLTHKRQYNKLKYVKIQMRRKMSTKKMSKYKRDMKIEMSNKTPEQCNKPKCTPLS